MTSRYRIDYSPAAISELAGIYACIAQDSPENAESMVDRILAAVESLDRFPHRQVVRDPRQRLSGAVHAFPVNPYVVFFEIAEREAAVHILRIRHGAQRPLKRF